METLLPELAKLVAEARGGAEAALEPLLATCERVLALEPEDLDTQRAKVVCLIEMGRYEEAESHCATLGGATYERAYCLYQLNREAEALALLGRGETEGEAAAVLGAQIRYRLGDYAASAAEFKRAAALAAEGGAASEHCTNVLAALVGARDWPAAAAYAASLPAGLEVRKLLVHTTSSPHHRDSTQRRHKRSAHRERNDHCQHGAVFSVYAAVRVENPPGPAHRTPSPPRPSLSIIHDFERGAGPSLTAHFACHSHAIHTLPFTGAAV